MAETLFEEKRRLDLERKEIIVREHYDHAGYKDYASKMKLRLGPLTKEQIEDFYKKLMILREEEFRQQLRNRNKS